MSVSCWYQTAVLCREEEAADASLDPEPIMVEEDEVFNNLACQAILAEEVGLAMTDFQDDRLRKGCSLVF